MELLEEWKIGQFSSLQNDDVDEDVVDIEKSAADAHRRLCAKHTFAFDSRITYSSGLPQIPGSGKDIAHLHKAISVAIPPQKKTKY